MIRILCVDDHELVRDGLTLIIEQQPDMKVVGSASSVVDAVAVYRRVRPDIALIDLRLGSGSGTEAIRGIREIDAEAKTIVLTVYQGDEDIYQAMRAGAITYVLKDTAAKDLIATIRAVYAGQRPLHPDLQARLAQRAHTRSLTVRELQVLELVALGMRTREIAMSLGIAEDTVQIHVGHVLDKLVVNDRTAAVTEALRR